MTERAISIEPTVVERYVMELAQDGAWGETGVSRTVYSPEWVAAQDRVAALMQDAGLTVSRDAVGNVWGRLEGSESGRSIVTGSHIDSQTPGGRYDGALGVLAGILALKALKEQLGTPRRTLEVVSFCEEEGSRFPAGYWGSRAVTGVIEANEPYEIQGQDGGTIADAMLAIGLDPDRITEAIRNDIETFIELHIEQGPLLEMEQVPVGIVEAIPGNRNYLVEVTGRTAHAGAVPIDLRRDAMAAAARMISGVVQTARDWGRPTVTTVGRMFVEPNLRPAIAGKVTFTIDARHSNAEKMQALFDSHENTIETIAEEENVEVSYRVMTKQMPCVSDLYLVDVLEEAARIQGVPAMKMLSGGCHDTLRMSRIARVAMVFVQSRDGLSHTPDEYTAPEHAAAGIQVLAGALHKLAY